jgi:hypothetical protein
VIRHSIIGKRLAVEFGEDGANVALRLKAIVDEKTEHFAKTVEKIKKAYTEVKKFADEAGISLASKMSDLV